MNSTENEEAERTVIGAVLLKPDCLSEVGDLLAPSLFAHPLNAAIWRAIIALDDQKKPIDPLSVVAHMEVTGKVGAEYLARLQSDVLTFSNLRYHAKTIADKAHRRRCLIALTELRGSAMSTDVDDASFADAIERRLGELIEKRQIGGPTPLRVALKEAIAELGEKYEARKRGEDVDVPGASTGWDDLDYLIGGLQRATFYVLAARPSMGKTGLVLNLSAAVAAHAPVLGFSLEMRQARLARRFLASHGRIDSKRIERADLDLRDWTTLTRAAGEIANLPIEIDDSVGLTFDQIRSRARQWRRRIASCTTASKKPPFVWIDYLQLIQGADDEKTREREVARISRGCHELSVELDCPVMALSQLNRALENRPDKRPRLADLRESGAIEQDADVVSFIYRDEVYSKDECKPEDKGIAEVIVGKNRDGDLGTVRLVFLNQYTKFEALADNRDDMGSNGRHWSDR